jgi:hypothetical protein
MRGLCCKWKGLKAVWKVLRPPGVTRCPWPQMPKALDAHAPMPMPLDAWCMISKSPCVPQTAPGFPSARSGDPTAEVRSCDLTVLDDLCRVRIVTSVWSRFHVLLAFSKVRIPLIEWLSSNWLIWRWAAPGLRDEAHLFKTLLALF